MIFVLFVGTSFFLLGYLIKNILISTNYKIKSPQTKLLPDRSNSARKKCSGFFDSVAVFVGEETNKALEEIFNIIIDRYVVCWYQTLSNDAGFLVQVRMYLQFLSAALIYRFKSIDASEFLQKLIPSIVNHLEHICESFQKYKEKTVDSMLEDTVLRGLGSHLHICMASRSSELAYLRALVNKLLPYVSLPPALIPLNKSQPEQTPLQFYSNSPGYRYQRALSSRGSRQSSRSPKLDSEHPFQRSSSIGSLFSRQTPWVKLDANRGAYSFLIEILSTCVLLPAMDAVANPDFINKLILSSIGDYADPDFMDSGNSTMVPVLNTYVQEWISWMDQKSLSTVRLDNILQQQDDLYPFTQYMKSVRSIEPLTAVLLMNDVDRRVRSEPLLPDICRELRAEIWHVLALIRGSSRTVMEQDCEEIDDETKGRARETDDDDSQSQSLDHEASSILPDSRLPLPGADESNAHQRLFNCPTELDDLLIEVIRKPEPSTLNQLVRKSLWKDTFYVAKKSIEKRFLPMYVESPEYLCHVLGISQRTMGPCPGSPKPVRTPGLEGSSSLSGPSLFGNSLKNMFSSTHTVEGHLIQDLASSANRPQARLSSRPCKPICRSGLLRDRIAEVSSGIDQSVSLAVGSSGRSTDSQHQLHSHYLQHLSSVVDMSDWSVYIPGLSRPEVQPARRLIDQLTLTTAGPTSRGTSGTHDSNSFRMRLFDDMNTTNEMKSLGSRAPQLSPQYMFTVRTERLVNGTRQPVARVDRKYAEFYVLEQKLLEFHGNAIAKQLPRRQFALKTFEFMDAKREEFEGYLQFLLAQPFLRNSELLFTFLTSKTPFTSSLLSELNLGRLVKSVPLKLTKEKGQFLDDFLVSFYVSCSPQPIILEPVDPRPKSAGAVTITVLPSSGVGTLGGIDTLASPDHYSIRPRRNPPVEPESVTSTPSFSESASSASRTLATTSTTTPTNPATGSLSVSRPIQYTVLDNRLRARMFWNNASLSGDRRKELIRHVCEKAILRWDGVTETILYCIHQLNVDPSSSSDSDQTKNCQSGEIKPDPGQYVDEVTSLRPPTPPDPWDVSHAGWNEAFLTGPLALDQNEPGVQYDTAPTLVLDSPTPERTIVNHSQEQHNHHDHPQHGRSHPHSQEQRHHHLDQGATRRISITWSDFCTAFVQSGRLLFRHLAVQYRYFRLWLCFQLWYYLHVPADRWLSSYLVGYLRSSLADSYTAHALQLLKGAIFSSYTPSTEAEKRQRKEQAFAVLRQTLSKIGFEYISSRERIKEVLDHFMLCFQYPKWNKQLSYVLLDHLVISLFPELQATVEYKLDSPS